MPTALGVLGGLALSPVRAAGMIAGGTAKLGYRAGKAGLAATAMAAMDVTGAMPIFGAAAGLVKGAKKGITAGYDVGKKLLKPVGEGTVAEDSALAAIAAAASETSKIQAETEKINAETAALTGEATTKKVEAQTTMGGIDVEILEKIYGEVASIREIVGGKDPESEKKELALDEQTRHKKFLKALAALGFGGKGDGKDKTTFSDALKIIKKYKIEKKISRNVISTLKSGINGKIPETPKKPKLTNIIIGNNKRSLDKMVKKAENLGYSVQDMSGLNSNVKLTARNIAKKLKVTKKSCIVFGGETTVNVVGTGKGGRNQELVLRLSKELKYYP